MPNNVRMLAGARPLQHAADLGDGVQPEVAAPEPPEHLTPEALGEWHRLVPELLRLGLLTRIDRAALAIHCAAWGRLQIVEEALRAEQTRLAAMGADPTAALVQTTPTGFSREAVLSRLAGDLSQQVDKFLSSFGMSPSSRARVTASRNDGQAALPGFDAGPGRFFAVGK